MTCYFRHLGKIFDQAGITVTAKNRQKLDKLVQDIVKPKVRDCPNTWKGVKKRLAENEAGFVAELREKWEAQQAPH